MTGVGWARTQTEALRARLLLYISDKSTRGQKPDFSWFAVIHAHPFIDIHAHPFIDWERLMTIVRTLETNGLVHVHRSLNGEMEFATLTADGRQLVQDMRDALANLGRREVAIRDALVCWLNEQRRAAARPDVGEWSVDLFFRSPHAVFYGDVFTNDEQDNALRHLNDKGLIEDHTFSGGRTARLTSDGIDCASEYDCNVREYLRARNQPQGVAYHQTNIGNQGQIAQSETVTQTQHQADSGPVLATLNMSGGIASIGLGRTVHMAQNVYGVDPEQLGAALRAVVDAAADLDPADREEASRALVTIEDEAADGFPEPGIVRRRLASLRSIAGRAVAATEFVAAVAALSDILARVAGG
jgi:hypothetical protein